MKNFSPSLVCSVNLQSVTDGMPPFSFLPYNSLNHFILLLDDDGNDHSFNQFVLGGHKCTVYNNFLGGGIISSEYGVYKSCDVHLCIYTHIIHRNEIDRKRVRKKKRSHCKVNARNTFF